MNSLRSFRYLVSGVLGILSLMATLASSAPRNFRQASQAASDVAVSMMADRDLVRAAQNISYTVTMTNLGPNDATFVDVAFAIPDGLQILSITCDQAISPDGPFCEYAGLPAGASLDSTLIATPQSGRAQHSRIATVSAWILFENADALDPNNTNNSATVKTKVIGRLP